MKKKIVIDFFFFTVFNIWVILIGVLMTMIPKLVEFIIEEIN